MNEMIKRKNISLYPRNWEKARKAYKKSIRLKIFKIEHTVNHEFIRCENFSIAAMYAERMYGEYLIGIRRYKVRPKGYKSEEEIPKITINKGE